MREISDLLQTQDRVWFYITDESKDTFYSELCALGAHYHNGEAVIKDSIGNLMGVHADGHVGHLSYMIWYTTFSVADAPMKVDYEKYHADQADYVITEPNIVPLGG